MSNEMRDVSARKERVKAETAEYTEGTEKKRKPMHGLKTVRAFTREGMWHRVFPKILTSRLDGGLRGKLDKLAAATRRSRSFLAAEAIREYVALNSWQIEEIQKGLAEAKRGEFASESEVKRVAKKWTCRGR